jgi:hypothetical protein
LLFAANDLLLRAVLWGRSDAQNQSQRSIGKAAKSGRRAKVRDLALQPDALGVATRLAAGRLREAGIVLKPLLRSAGLSVSQINRKDIRIGVASQIKFLELAAEALRDPLLGFRLARDGEPREAGVIHYVAASSETLGDALDRDESEEDARQIAASH